MQKLKHNDSKFFGANQQVRLQNAQQQNKEAFQEEAFQDGNFTEKKHSNTSKASAGEYRKMLVLVHLVINTKCTFELCMFEIS